MRLWVYRYIEGAVGLYKRSITIGLHKRIPWVYRYIEGAVYKRSIILDLNKPIPCILFNCLTSGTFVNDLN